MGPLLQDAHSQSQSPSQSPDPRTLPLRSLSNRHRKSSRRTLRAVDSGTVSDLSSTQRSPTTSQYKLESDQDHQTPPLQNGLPANSPTTLTHASKSSRPKTQRKHSHGLSWTSHTRDSLVDNLLLSLDQISSQPPGTPPTSLDSQRSRSSTASPPGPPMSQFNAYRTRGHNHSNSISSEQERNESPNRHATADPSHTRRPSALSATRIMTGMRGSVDSQSPETARPTRGWSRHGSKSSDITAGDNTSGSPSRMYAREASRERDYRGQNRDRSRSRPGRLQDSILARGRPVPSNGSPLGSTPEPATSGGPNATRESPSTNRHVHESTLKDQRATAPSRKQSSQSQNELPRSPKLGQDIPDNARTTAGDFLRSSSMKSLQQPGHSGTGSTATPPGSAHKHHGSQQEEKRGFFKRVFGSSNSRSNLSNSETANGSGSPSVSRQGSYSNIHYPNGHSATSKRDRDSSPAPSGTRELTKKPSSFFRRRKKSVTDMSDAPALPPPPQLSGSGNDASTPGRSSLYKAMDPYLTGKDQSGQATPRQKAREPISENQKPRKRDETSPSTEDSDDPELFHSGYDKSPDAPIRSLSITPNDMRRPSAAPSTSELPLRNGSVAGGQSPTLQMKARKKDKPTSLSPPPPHLRSISAGDRDGAFVVSKGRTSPRDGETRLPKSIGRPDLALDTASQKPEQGERTATKSATYLEPSPSHRQDDTPSDRDTFYTPTNDSSQAPKMEARITTPDDLGMSYEQPTAVPSFQVEGQASSPYMDHLRSERQDSDPMRNMSIATTATAMSSMSGILEGPTFEDREHALSIFNGDEDFMPRATAAQFLGDRKTASVNTLRAYVELFNLTGQTILGSMRMLCNRLVLKAESQQVDRILDALAARWCECNPHHGFKLKDCVHTIFYSLLLLNTDMHVAEIDNRMTRAQFVKNTLPLIKKIVAEAPADAFDPADRPERPGLQWHDSSNSMATIDSGEVAENRRSSVDSRRPTLSKRMSWSLGMNVGIAKPDEDQQLVPNSGSNALVSERFDGKPAEWHYELEAILKSFFTAIKNEALPLNRQDRPGLRRTNSGKSMAPSEMSVRTKKSDFYSMSGRWGRNRTRSKFYGSSTMASSRTSFDDGGSIFSTAASKFSRTLTMNTDPNGIGADQLFPQQIGFANALSQSNAREDGIEDDNMSINPQKFLLEDDSLELAGAPWAKEGILKHKHHLEASDKKAKERNWNECFAVIEKGYLRLFSFNSKGGKTGSLGVRKSMQVRGKAPSIAPSVVGGGNWMQNAESLGSFLLRQTIASTLPPPGYSKARPHVWALSLPTGAVHLFQVGTAEIAQEFMNTANYWSARLSKEPLQGGVDNIEYGWGESVLTPPLIHPSLVAAATAQQGSPDPNGSKPPSRSGRHSAQNSISIPQSSHGPGTRASIAGSIRGSIDHGMMRARTAGDKVTLEEWKPPAQSMMASQLMEVDQLQGLKDYVASVEGELTKHNDLRAQIPGAYSPRHPNLIKAIANWEKKSAYLLREIVKFRTYIDALNLAQEEKKRIDADRAEREAEKEERERKKAARLAAEAQLAGDADRSMSTATGAERTGSTATSGGVQSGHASLDSTPRIGSTSEAPRIAA
ncbi:Sec7 domain-containing protein 1 [Elsinoe fawcettii]|nr:Sec7 domain-containing protein 1 [Elsinoe fawcettii]